MEDWICMCVGLLWLLQFNSRGSGVGQTASVNIQLFLNIVLMSVSQYQSQKKKPAKAQSLISCNGLFTL